MKIITDLPQASASRTKEEIHHLYLSFFEKAQQHLNDGGIVILYAAYPQYAAEADPQAWKLPDGRNLSFE